MPGIWYNLSGATVWVFGVVSGLSSAKEKRITCNKEKGI